MNKQTALLKSAISLILCFSMLLGSTYAWFTDSATSTGNIITSGTLDVEMYWTDDLDRNVWYNVEDPNYNTIFSYDNWEPGYTDVRYIKIVNNGNLAMNYKLAIAPQGEVGKLAEVINVYFANEEVDVRNREDLSDLRAIGLLNNVLNGGATADGTLLPANQVSDTHPSGEVIVTMAMNMITTAGNEYQGKDAGDFTISVVATQAAFEKDSFGANYDGGAILEVLGLDRATTSVTPVDGKVPEGGAAITGSNVSAFVPAGVAMEAGANELTLTVSPKNNSSTGFTPVNDEVLIPVDVHIDGIAKNNTVPIIIDLGEILPKHLNMGNYRLYHVENGVNSVMTLVDSTADLTVHNTFTYDPLTGEVSVAMATFSEIAAIAETNAAWEGKFDYSWYEASKTELTIANADQLAAFGAIVGGMNDKTRDSFADKTVKLLSDINLNHGTVLNDAEGTIKTIFYPIGYYNSTGNNTGNRPTTVEGTVESTVYSFEGTFDGNGHKISNFYQNTWEMFGDYNTGYSGTPNYYKDAMGLFGYVYGGTIKNLTVDNFESDGEFTPTGVIAAYAAGNATFENIAITNCNPRVYNTGNGGIIGIAGNTSAANDDHITLKNITVDNSNKISALWGSWDVACGGLVGMYRGNVDGNGNATGDTISFENCHVSAQIDVNNDVCANYQYYAYRYAGMIIGSVRHNTTNADGKTIPNMKGISAKDCTANFGTWNDYYYCELVDNTTASYTHDYQMSRLVEVKGIDGTTITYLDGKTGTVPASGRANYVIVDYSKGHGTNNATCYHFKNGEVWNHADGGTEIINGVEVLKEDKQHLYLEFNNLFTGYGWGVSSMGINKWNGITALGITEGNQEESVVKFETTGKSEVSNNIAIKISDLFSYIEKCGIEVKNDSFHVGITNVDQYGNPIDNGKVSAIFNRADDWADSTITLAGTGRIAITVQDYYFCTPTTIIVNVTDRQPAEKFDIVMNNGDFLHRVGNSGTVALDKLFKAKDGVTVGTISVTVEAVDGTGASGTYSNNAIQFNGTGVVKVTITDNDYCIPTELMLEVVDATNLTSATGTTTGGNFVLLNDVNASSYVNYWNCTVYGNGFTYSLKGAPTAYNSKQGHGIIITKNATLDNLVIVGDVYNSYGAYTNQDYYNSAIDVIGETTIQNCYVANCSAPVRARQADVTIKNSTLYGGTVANLLIMSGTATLENVTTSNYDDGRALVGMGIVIHSDATESAKLVLNGTLTQYNFISESKVPTDTYAKNLHDAMFNSNCSQYQFGTSPNRYVNTGIISLTSTFNGEDITDNAKTGYVGKSLRVSSYDGYVYTQANTSGAVNNNAPEYKPETQGAVPPSYSFDYTNKNYVAKTEGSNDYCYAENGVVNISMDEGDTFNWDTSILTIGKGVTNYTVAMNGTDYTGKSIAFNTAGDYTVTYTYTDDNNSKLDENGNITIYSVTYTKTVNITVAVVKATTKHAEFTFGSDNTASTTVTVGNNTYVMPNVSGTSSTIGSTTVSGQTIYYPIVEIIMSDGKTSHSSGWYAYFPVFSGAVTITDYANGGTGDKMTPYNGSTTTMPSGLSVVGDPTSLFKYQSGTAAGSTPVVKSNKLVYSSAKIEAKRSEYSTVVQYSYTDNAGATYYYYIGYHAPAQSYTSCVTADTLVTLADGTQKRIDQVTYADQLLVWDFDKGEYTYANSSIIENHGYDMNEVIKLTFEDGTVVKVVNVHGFFDADLNKWIDINAKNAANHIGHSFTQVNGDVYKTVKLVSVDVTAEYVEAWSILTADYYNCVLEGMFSVTPPATEQLAFFEIGEDMKYDEVKKQADIEKYGLYTYEELSHLMTREQFEAFNFAEIKIAVGKGLITFDELCALLDVYA